MTSLENLSKAPLTDNSITPGSAIWNAYARAFEARYSVAPVRNAKTASLCKQLVARFPAAEATEVAAFYLAVEDKLYTGGMHPLELLLRDAEKIRARWATGSRLPPASMLSVKGQENMASALAWMARRRAGGQLVVPDVMKAETSEPAPRALPAHEPEWLTSYRADQDVYWEQRRHVREEA